MSSSASPSAAVAQQRGNEPQGRPVSDDAILKVTKEITVKFIEVGRLSPANFAETFNEIHRTVRDAVRS
ncbi:MAG: hypothetical protein U5J62_11595 [Desulfurivibrio sp.]|nr:hypothetical protein [Desulfurivibrio sp.]